MLLTDRAPVPVPPQTQQQQLSKARDRALLAQLRAPGLGRLHALSPEVEKAGLLPLRPEDGGSAEDGVAGGARRMSGCRARACAAALRSTLLSHAACDLGSWPMWWSQVFAQLRSQSQERSHINTLKLQVTALHVWKDLAAAIAVRSGSS